MLVDHIEGTDRIRSLRNKFELELECVCLNNDFMEKETIIKKLRSCAILANDLPDQTVLKYSESHTKERPYYEFSVFCNKEDYNFYKKMVEDAGLELDIIHDTFDDGEFSPSEFSLLK